ncbi:MAG: acyl-[acyl-carrier-protein] thioesterase [Flavobacterium sp.]|nr:acyl-[acyl-carrier-protein] thioesterase [Flavobacterium sp.]
MPISNQFTSVYSKNWEINFTQCNPNGYLKYTDLCNLIQLTAAAHSELGGISFTDMQEFNQAWVLSRMRVEITKLPKWKDEITINTWINNLENSRSIRAIEIVLNGRKIIGSETFWVVFNTKIRRPEELKLPISHFKLFPERKATEISLSKIIVADSLEIINEKKVLLSDLDIVNHVNNVKYLEWCLDYVKPDIILNQKINSFEMNFLKELSLNDRVHINKCEDLNKIQFNITKENKTSFALEINLK